MDQYFGFFALKLLSLHKYKFYQKKPFFTQKIFQLSGDILVEKRGWKHNDIIVIWKNANPTLKKLNPL